MSDSQYFCVVRPEEDIATVRQATYGRTCVVEYEGQTLNLSAREPVVVRFPFAVKVYNSRWFVERIDGEPHISPEDYTTSLARLKLYYDEDEEEWENLDAEYAYRKFTAQYKQVGKTELVLEDTFVYDDPKSVPLMPQPDEFCTPLRHMGGDWESPLVEYNMQAARQRAVEEMLASLSYGKDYVFEFWNFGRTDVLYKSKGGPRVAVMESTGKFKGSYEEARKRIAEEVARVRDLVEKHHISVAATRINSPGEVLAEFEAARATLGKVEPYRKSYSEYVAGIRLLDAAIAKLYHHMEE